MRLSAEPRAACHQNTTINASVKDFLLDLFEASLTVIGMLGVIYIEPDLIVL